MFYLNYVGYKRLLWLRIRSFVEPSFIWTMWDINQAFHVFLPIYMGFIWTMWDVHESLYFPGERVASKNRKNFLKFPSHPLDKFLSPWYSIIATGSGKLELGERNDRGVFSQEKTSWFFSKGKKKVSPWSFRWERRNSLSLKRWRGRFAGTCGV